MRKLDTVQRHVRDFPRILYLEHPCPPFFLTYMSSSTSTLPDPVLETLLQWLADNNVWIDPRIRIASDPAHPEAGYGVYALADIPYGVPGMVIYRCKLCVHN